MAFLKGSFYERLRPFAPDEKGTVPFKGVRARPLASPEPVLEHTVVLKERPDSLAQNYYADPRSWRRIADVSNEIFFEDSLYDPKPVEENGRERLGNVILIPRRRESR